MMCEECEGPVQFVAYFNKAGGKMWRPPRLPTNALSAGDAGRAGLSVTGFSCDGLVAPGESARPVTEQEPAAPGKPT
jgi:hypothetical protein